VAIRPLGGLASAAELAAVVIASDELTQQRTRQQRVLEAARSRLSDLAPTVALRGERTTIDAPPRRSRVRRIAIGLVAIAALAIAFVLWNRGPRGADSSTASQASQAGESNAGDAKPVVSITGDRSDDSKTGDVKAGGSKAGGSRPDDTNAGDSMIGGSKADSKAGDAKRVESSPGDAKAGDARPGDARAGDSKAAKPGDARAGDAKVVDPRIGETTKSDLRRGSAIAKRGTISIDSKPFATIYIDGARIDVTPILGYSLPAGPHRLRAVLKDGRTKELAIDIPAGKAARPVMLAW
jgi:hypothetical protein